MNWKSFFLGFGISIVIVLLIYFFTPVKQMVITQELSVLKDENTALKQQNLQLDTEIILLSRQTDSIGELLTNTYHLTKQLQNELQQKLDSIHLLSDRELYRYFSEFKTHPSQN